MAIDAQVPADPAHRASRQGGRRAARSGPDRLSVMLFSLAAFLVVLALLARQLPATTYGQPRPVRVLRKIYRTTVVETIAGGGGPNRTSVAQSVSSSGSVTGPAAGPTTRTS